MTLTPRMRIQYPTARSRSWFAAHEAGLLQIDTITYASREDRGLFFFGGGALSWGAGPSTLTWTDTLIFTSALTGFVENLPAGTMTLADGEYWYVNLTRGPSTNITLTPQHAQQQPSTDEAYVIAIRRGSSVYFRGGLVLGDGDTASLFATTSLSGAVPTSIIIGAGSAGVGGSASRGDHSHPVSSAAPVGTGTANAQGVALTLSRSDHVHRLLLAVQQSGAPIGTRPIINFIGATVADNGVDDRVDVTVTGGGGASTFTYTCPATVAVRDVVYISAANTVDRADATTAATMPVVGIVTAKPTLTTADVMVGTSEVGGFVGLTAGATYYGSLVAGGITLTAPTTVGQVVQKVGQARNTTTLLVQLGERTQL